MSNAPNTIEKAIWLKLFALGGVPPILGNVWYVHNWTGSDLNSGKKPSTPFATIDHALSVCIDDNDDYIFVMQHWQEVVTIDVDRVHIIGVGTSPNHPFVAMNAAADTAIFTVSHECDDCEIAGFNFGGGAAHAAIETVGGTPMGLYIHDCVFGHSFAGDTPEDGIRITLNATNIRIERCTFLGNGGCAGGTLTRDGIRWTGGTPLNGVIINNVFQGCPGVAINFTALAAGQGGIVIKDNVFALDADTQGAAITLGATCAGFLVVGNRAQFGSDAMAANPYLDQAVADQNHWTYNWVGNALMYPA